MKSNNIQHREYDEKKVKQRKKDIAMLKSLLFKIIFFAVLLTGLFKFMIGLAPMKGGDMEPVLSAGDLLIYYRLEKNYNRNDTVIIERDGNQYVGRLVGMPNDTINITKGGTININGNNIFETNIFYETKPYPDTGRYPLTLKDNQYFLLADKRDTAKDSRYFGPITEKEIKGKLISALIRY